MGARLVCIIFGGCAALTLALGGLGMWATRVEVHEQTEPLTDSQRIAELSSGALVFSGLLSLSASVCAYRALVELQSLSDVVRGSRGWRPPQQHPNTANTPPGSNLRIGRGDAWS